MTTHVPGRSHKTMSQVRCTNSVELQFGESRQSRWKCWSHYSDQHLIALFRRCNCCGGLCSIPLLWDTTKAYLFLFTMRVHDLKSHPQPQNLHNYMVPVYLPLSNLYRHLWYQQSNRNIATWCRNCYCVSKPEKN